MYHAVPNIVCFETFSGKHKENELCIKYTLFGGAAGNLSPPTILQIKQIWWFYFIYLTRRTAPHTVFEFLNNKHLRSKWIFFSQKIRFFVYFLFCVHAFTRKRSNIKKMVCTVSATQFPTKWCPFQPLRSKTVGGDTYLVAKSVLFQEGRKTHQNITKWTMCQISM